MLASTSWNTGADRNPPGPQLPIDGRHAINRLPPKAFFRSGAVLQPVAYEGSGELSFGLLSCVREIEVAAAQANRTPKPVFLLTPNQGRVPKLWYHAGSVWFGRRRRGLLASATREEGRPKNVGRSAKTHDDAGSVQYDLTRWGEKHKPRLKAKGAWRYPQMQLARLARSLIALRQCWPRWPS
jgi:hypothetical protein